MYKLSLVLGVLEYAAALQKCNRILLNHTARNSKDHPLGWSLALACLGGFEPLAFGVGVQRSIHLSYRHKYLVVIFAPTASGAEVDRFF